MGFFAAFWHLLNFAAPALGVAGVVTLAGLLLPEGRVALRVFGQRCLVNASAGALALAVALWLLGRDGKVLGYGALVLAVATAQWVQSRAWQTTAGKPFAK